MGDIFSDYQIHEPVSEEMLQKYKGKIPVEIMKIWEKYGLGSFLNGYLQVVNPDEYKDILDETYFRKDVAIPVFATGLGDIITWEENRHLMLIKYRKGTLKGLSFKYFFQDLEDVEFMEEELDSKQYNVAIEKLGVPEFDQCFGYVSLLGLGGVEKVENLQKVKLKEHIYLITQFMGPIE